MFGPVTISSRRCFIELQVVGDEGRVEQLLDHRMTPGADVDARCVAERRPAPVERLRAPGQRHQHIALGDGRRHAAQAGSTPISVLSSPVYSSFSRASERSRADSTLPSNSFSSGVM